MYESENRKYLLHIADRGYSVEKKRKALIVFLDLVEKLQEDLGTEKVHLEDENRLADFSAIPVDF